MTSHYPRRVKDLPALEPDSDDESSKQQYPHEMQQQPAQKEVIADVNRASASSSNSSTYSNLLSSNTKSSGTFTNMRMYPKRRSELPTLESDDSEEEEEENLETDNLNCAILNDSFIMSPGDSSLLKTPGPPVAVKNKCAAESSGNLSFVLNFDKLALNAENKENANGEKCAAGERPSATSTARKFTTYSRTNTCPLQSIQEDRVGDDGGKMDGIGALQRFNSDPTAQQSTTCKDLETPLKTTTTADVAPPTNAARSQQADAQFATPQIRSFSLQRRPRDLCSSQSQRTRSTIVNEFRSQKVLFQTPMAITRPPITMLPNDSITLSLCDTINETGDTPNAVEKIAQHATATDQEQPTKLKSKKSLDNAFNESGNQAQQQEVDKETSTSAALTSTETNGNKSGKDGTCHINNIEYSIMKKLGCGGSSSVYLALRNDTGKECALKVVDLRGDPIVVEGYLNETKLLAKLQGNVCVVALYDYQLLQKESRLFLVMEKGDSDLHKILQTYTTNLPLYVLMNFWYQMLQAVNYIHQNGVIHSDLKPANFLMVNGRLKLIDFGIASNIAIDSTSIIKFSQAGTFNYISPEALTDTSTGTSPMRSNQPKIKISTKSDVWSLGCILYLLLYKKTPFSHIKNIYAKISAISSPTHPIEYPAIPLYYPAMLVLMTKNCLQHNPKERPSCAELLQYPFNMVIPIQNLVVHTKQRSSDSK